jgi:hypothetical protein
MGRQVDVGLSVVVRTVHQVSGGVEREFLVDKAST